MDLNHREAYKYCLKLWEVFTSCIFASQFVVVHSYFGVELPFNGLVHEE